MILKCDNEKVRKLVRYAETLKFEDKLRLGINILESDYISVKYERILEWLKKVLSLVDEEYRKTQFIPFLNYKHLLLFSAQLMELTEKEQKIFTFELLVDIYKIVKNKNL